MPRAHASAVIPAPIDALWELVRDFAGHTPWIHNAIRTAIDCDSGTQVGGTRTITFTDRADERERLIALDDVKHTLKYALTIPHEPLSSLFGTMRLLPVTADNTTYMERYVDFEVADGSDPEIFRKRAAGLLASSLSLVSRDPRVVGTTRRRAVDSPSIV